MTKKNDVKEKKKEVVVETADRVEEPKVEEVEEVARKAYIYDYIND